MTETATYSPGDIVEALVMRSDASDRLLVLQLSDNVPAYLSWDAISDELRSLMTPATYVSAAVRSVDTDPITTVVLRKVFAIRRKT